MILSHPAYWNILIQKLAVLPRESGCFLEIQEKEEMHHALPFRFEQEVKNRIWGSLNLIIYKNLVSYQLNNCS